jgi:hypothetical protein
MARKKATTTPIADELQTYTDKITKLAMARGVLMEQKRMNEWIIERTAKVQDPVEINLLQALAKVVNDG